METHPIVFAAYADRPESLRHVAYLADSIRRFAGEMSRAPIRIYLPEDGDLDRGRVESELQPWRVLVHRSQRPEDSAWYYYSGKTFAAGQAERDVERSAETLVWMDEDTIVLNPPVDFTLAHGISLAYRPVMHNRTGSLKSEKPNPFWQRIYDLFDLSEGDLFPMVTPVDKQTIRAYFNAGLLVVRPECGILRKWGRDFTVLYRDPELARMCRNDLEARIFLHQTALVGAVLNTLRPEQAVELSEAYNYPLFFERMFDATRRFGSIDEVVTLRYDTYFRNPDADWKERLQGDPELVTWLVERLSGETDRSRG